MVTRRRPFRLSLPGCRETATGSSFTPPLPYDAVRALGVYGAESGRKAEADAAVGDVFGALNALDSDLFQMSRGRAETNGAQLENRCDALIEVGAMPSSKSTWSLAS